MRVRRFHHPGALGACILLAVGSFIVAPAYGAPTIQLSLWTGFPEAGPFYERAAADYRRSHPNVEVTVLTHPLRDFERKLAATIPADTAADIIQIPNASIRRFVEAGLIPSNPAAQDRFLKGGSFPTPMVTQDTFKGRTYGVPFWQGRQVLYWNIKAFQEVGLTHAPRTWDEVIDYCQKLTKRDPSGRIIRGGIGLRLFGGGSGVAQKWWFWLYPAGGTMIETRPGGKYRAGYNNQAGRDALKLYVDLVHKYQCDDPTLKRDAEGFALEQSAMFTRESWVIGFLRDQSPGLLYTTAPLPRLRRAGTNMNIDNLYVTRATKNPDVAWDFVMFVLRPENQQLLLEMTGWQPTRQDVDYSAQIRKAPQYKAFFEVPEGFEFYWDVPIGSFDEIQTKLAARLERAFADRSLVDNPAGIAKVIEEAAKETNDILRREGMLGE